MTPNDIKVGQRYGHKEYPGNIWLGAGKREPFTYYPEYSFSERHLVLIYDSETNLHIGFIFKTPDDDYGSDEGTWGKFFEIPETNN
jgi:hypothetical protein